MTHIKIKICGITRLDDAKHCESCGVDAIGFMFVPASKRYLSVDAAAAIAAKLGPFVTKTGLFLNADEHAVHAALEQIPDLLLQFHGQESAGWCNAFNRPYIKVIGMASGLPSAAVLEQYTNASAFLFDSNAAGALGGTGHSFDWSATDWPALRLALGKPLILAGGLSVDNLRIAIETVQPYAVDVSSGVESAPGIKDPALITRFTEIISAVNP